MSSATVLLLVALSFVQTTPAPPSTGSRGSDPSAKPPPTESPSQSPNQSSTSDPNPSLNGIQPAAADDLPVSLARIQRALAAPGVLKILEPTVRDGRPVYRVDIEGAKIDMRTLLGQEALRGAVPYGGMTHQEFLDLVTPDDVRGYAAFSNAEGITVAATSIALHWAVLKAIDVLKKAKDAREQDAATKEVEQALEALRKARRAAGLPEK
jgi:hypothetical protein